MRSAACRAQQHHQRRRFHLRSSDPSLFSLEGLGNIATASSLFVMDNVSLPTCEALSLRDRIGLENMPGGAIISGNDDAGICQ
jgi:hypothetical protein